jgi:hypothetical protein
MKSPAGLNHKEIADLLNRCWMTHDGMWFYHCLKEFGIAKANQLNKAAIKSLAPVEIKRMKKTLGVEKIETFEEFKSFCSGAFELFISDFMGARMTFPEKNVLHWEFVPQKCFAFRGMQNLGVVDDYECGVIYRVACWIDSLKIQYTIDPSIAKCMMPAKGYCAGDFRLNLSG